MAAESVDKRRAVDSQEKARKTVFAAGQMTAGPVVVAAEAQEEPQPVTERILVLGFEVEIVDRAVDY